MAQQYAIQYGLPVTILRSSWVFEGTDLLHHFSLLRNVDPAEKGHGFGDVSEEILNLVRAGQERIPILVDGNGVPLHRHIVHVDDVMQAFGLMLDNPAAVGQSFNIAAPAPFNYRVAAEHLSGKMGIPTVEIPAPATTRSRSTSPAPGPCWAMPQRTTSSAWPTGRWPPRRREGSNTDAPVSARGSHHR